MNTNGIYGLDAGLVDCLKTLKGSRQQCDKFELTADKVSKTIDKYSISPEINSVKYKSEFISFFSQHQSRDSEINNRIMTFFKNLEPQMVKNIFKIVDKIQEYEKQNGKTYQSNAERE